MSLPVSRASCRVALLLLVAGVSALLAETPPQAPAIYAESIKLSASPAGWPLPLIAEYNTGTLTMMKPEDYRHQWQPSYMLELIEQGHRAMVTFADPILLVNRASLDAEAWLNDYYAPAMKRCAELKQPITVMDWNDAAYLYDKEPWARLPPEENSLLITADGTQRKRASPFGPLSVWRDLGRWMTEHETMHQLQAIYPDPPRVIFISNNKGSRLSDWKEAAESRRFIEKHGAGRDRELVETELTAAWIAAWSAHREGMREGMREELVEDAWKRNSRITGYNAYGPDHLGRWGGWRGHAVTSGIDVDGPYQATVRIERVLRVPACIRAPYVSNPNLVKVNHE